MSCCCLNIYSIGCIYGCDPTLTTGLTAPTTGDYTLRYDYMGVTYTQQTNFAESEAIVFELEDMAFADYVFEIIKPDGNKLTLTVDDIIYDCFKFKILAPQISGAEPAEEVVIEALQLAHILFVDNNGDDDTAEVGNIHLPYRTIKGAVTDAVSGDEIHIFPGVYTDTVINKGSDGIEKRGLVYYFHRGAIVNSVGKLFYTTDTDGNITVRGNGVFNPTTGFIDAQTGVVNYDCEFDTVFSTSYDNVRINNGTYRLKGISMKTNFQYCARISGTATGRLYFEILDNRTSSFTGACIYYINHSTDAISRTCYSEVGMIYSNANGNFGAIQSINSSNLIAYHKGDITHTLTNVHSFAGCAIGINTGRFFIEGNVYSTNGGYGLSVYNSAGGATVSELYFKGKIKTTGNFFAIVVQNAGKLIFSGTGINNSPSAATVYIDNAVVTIKDSTIKNEDPNPTATVIQYGATNANLYLRNVILLAGITGNGYAINAPALRSFNSNNIYSNVDLHTNVIPIGAQIMYYTADLNEFIEPIL